MRSLRDANLFAIAMASRRCVGRKEHLYLQMRYVRQRGVLCRGATVYAASRAQTNIRGSLRDANLFAAAEACGICGCRKATVYLQIDTVRQRGVLCRGATVYAASKAQPNIRGWRCDANLFAIAMASRRCVCCKAHLYLQIRYVRQRGVLCRGATVYAASKAQPNIRGSRCDANLFAAAMASRRCVCCKAHLYLQIRYGQATGSALPRRNSICGKQSADEYTQKFKHLNREETRKTHYNSLKTFPLHDFGKHLPWFRCSGKGEYLNLAARQNPAAKPLTTSALQDFQ